MSVYTVRFGEKIALNTPGLELERRRKKISGWEDEIRRWLKPCCSRFSVYKVKKWIWKKNTIIIENGNEQGLSDIFEDKEY